MLKHGKLMAMLAIAALAVAGAVACGGDRGGGTASDGTATGNLTNTPSDATSGPGSTNTPLGATAVATPAGNGTPSPNITPSAGDLAAIEALLSLAQDAATQGNPDRLKELLRPSVRDVIEEEVVDAVDDDCLGGLTRTETLPTIDLKADGTASVEVEYLLDGGLATVEWDLERQADGTWLLASLPRCPRRATN